MSPFPHFLVSLVSLNLFLWLLIQPPKCRIWLLIFHIKKFLGLRNQRILIFQTRSKRATIGGNLKQFLHQELIIVGFKTSKKHRSMVLIGWFMLNILMSHMLGFMAIYFWSLNCTFLMDIFLKLWVWASESSSFDVLFSGNWWVIFKQFWFLL
jgi:hypothetical protein